MQYRTMDTRLNYLFIAYAIGELVGTGPPHVSMLSSNPGGSDGGLASSDIQVWGWLPADATPTCNKEMVATHGVAGG